MFRLVKTSLITVKHDLSLESLGEDFLKLIQKLHHCINFCLLNVKKE